MAFDWTPADGYSAYHAPRHRFLLDALERQGANASSAILDIGASQLTTLMRDRFGARVDTLGFGQDVDGPSGRHFQFDLNSAADEGEWRRDLPVHDFVVMAEVLEHLHTAPEWVLTFVRSLLKPGGHLVLQTPNATSLPKRIKLLLGRNPYERLRKDSRNPGHFRESTRAELVELAGALGFVVESIEMAFYFDTRFVHDESGRLVRYRPLLGRLKNVGYRALPPALREGITTVWRRAD